MIKKIITKNRKAINFYVDEKRAITKKYPFFLSLVYVSAYKHTHDFAFDHAWSSSLEYVKADRMIWFYGCMNFKTNVFRTYFLFRFILFNRKLIFIFFDSATSVHNADYFFAQALLHFRVCSFFLVIFPVFECTRWSSTSFELVLSLALLNYLVKIMISLNVSPLKQASSRRKHQQILFSVILAYGHNEG